MEGVPDTLVYDQDRVFLVSENKGDLILTEKFRAYSREVGFGLHFCRKADPQSKGKVENVIKYIKQNFLYNRPFCDIDTLNQEALAWLARTANHLPHSTTHKQPSAEWLMEKAYLKPYRAVERKGEERIAYTVRKDNSISYRGNFYSLPLGTYKGKGSKVELLIDNERLLIYDLQGGLLCTHKQSLGKGQKILNTDHKREKATGIETLIHEVCSGLQDPAQGRNFLGAIRSEKPRYIRDQALLLKAAIQTYPKEILSEALAYCCTHRLNSASDLKSICEHLSHTQQAHHTAKVVHMNPFSASVPRQAYIQPATSSISDYADLF